MRRSLLVLSLACAALALPAAQAPERLILTNVKLLDVAAGRLRPVAAVVIEGRKITAIQTTAAPLEGSAIRDLRGATLVPGLADLAVQTQPGLAIDVDYFYAMSLAFGVTHVRAVDANLPWAVAQRARAADGEILAPRTWTSGPLLDMRTPMGARNQALLGGGLLPLVRVPDGPSLAREVARQAGQKVDWIRLGENVPAEAVRAAVGVARASKTSVSVAPVAASMGQSAQAGARLLDGFGMPVRPAGDADPAARGKAPASAAPPANVLGAIEAAWAQSSDQDRKALIAVLRRTSTALAPMLAATEVQRGALTDVDRDLAYLPERLRSPIQARFVVGKQGDGDIRSKAREKQLAFVRDLVKGGGKVVTASGAQADGWPIPGVTIHRELALLVEAGLTPVEALRGATTWAGDVLGVSASGAWRVGSAADFFVVKGDPTSDIGALTDIVMVVRAGELLERDQLLKQARLATGQRK